MQNLIESPALLSILKDPRRNCGEIQGKSVAESRSDVVKSVAGGGVQLNANAQVFVPRSVAAKAQEVDAPMDLDELKRHFEFKDEKQKKTMLILPWHGFPKRPEKSANPKHVTPMANEDHAYEIKLGGKRARKANACAEEKRLKTNQKSAEEAVSTEDGPSLPVDLTLEEKRLEQGRKVALEALKLVEQRRLRDPSFGPFKKTEGGAVIRHISRSPVRFTKDERERVRKLRVDKKERIEKVLKDMLQKKKPPKLYPEKWQKEARVQEDGEQQTCQVQKPSKANREKQSKPEAEVPQEQQQEKPAQQRMMQKRYFGLQRATTTNAQAEAELEPQPQGEKEPPAEAKQQPPRRYIPTTKEWDEKCRTRQLERVRVSDKENEKSKSNQNQNQKPSGTANKPVLWRADTSRPLTVSNSAKDSQEVIKLENPTLAPVIPRYVPPIPVADPADLALTRLLHSEKRRGNLTYAQALLKRPPGEVDGSTNPPLNNVVRYSVEELLMLEPQPGQLLAPILLGTSKGLGCLLK